MAALSANRLVWSAMSLITAMTWPMFSARLDRDASASARFSVMSATELISSTVLPTTTPPEAATLFAWSDASAVSEAFLATSSTVAFISSMAVATWLVSLAEVSTPLAS